MEGKKIAVVFGLCLTMFVGSVAAFFIYKPAEIVPPLPIHGKTPAFSFTATDGETFASSKLEGKVWVADFFFSTCAGPCPTMAKNMGKIQETFKDRGDDLNLASFTVYPDNDTPEVLAKYAKKVKADTSRWHFLTGPKEDLLSLAVEGFKVGDSSNLLNHSQKFILVDREMQIRGYYEGTDDGEIAELVQDLERLLKEG
ncbi:SCO family protein [Acanthopleuribacter pedis]|uniref:SCO family protein n=1 Tax=Acanthopleuribacter pedis TaxID=442870 RepID=A0A8J7U894_9BACT|nr:SCO family protein [Acanthopleuribacter pedis]MBO1323338.1 SCO family protein [Acanthopleuribacter pedis]